MIYTECIWLGGVSTGLHVPSLPLSCVSELLPAWQTDHTFLTELQLVKSEHQLSGAHFKSTTVSELNRLDMIPDEQSYTLSQHDVSRAYA